MKITKSKLKQVITEELQNILAEQAADDDAPGSTKYMSPAERQAARADRLARHAATTAAAKDPVDTPPALAPAATNITDRALAILAVLYPKVSDDEFRFTLQNDDDEGNLASNLFGFLYPGVSGAKPNPQLMAMAEEWIGTFDNLADAPLEIRGRTNEENVESLLTYIEEKGYERGKAGFARAKAASAEAGAAKNVPVGRSATPGTEEYEDLQRMLKMPTPPKKRRRRR